MAGKGFLITMLGVYFGMLLFTWTMSLYVKHEVNKGLENFQQEMKTHPIDFKMPDGFAK